MLNVNDMFAILFVISKDVKLMKLLVVFAVHMAVDETVPLD